MLIPCIFSVKYNYFASCPDSFLGRTNNHFRPMQLIFFSLPIQTVLAIYCFWRTNLSLAVIKFSRAIHGENPSSSDCCFVSGEQKSLLPSWISDLSEHTPSFCYYLGFCDVGLFSERQRERLKEGEMEERGRGREEEKFL